jgi:hypothetical protein
MDSIGIKIGKRCVCKLRERITPQNRMLRYAEKELNSRYLVHFVDICNTPQPIQTL